MMLRISSFFSVAAVLICVGTAGAQRCGSCQTSLAPAYSMPGTPVVVQAAFPAYPAAGPVCQPQGCFNPSVAVCYAAPARGCCQQTRCQPQVVPMVGVPFQARACASPACYQPSVGAPGCQQIPVFASNGSTATASVVNYPSAPCACGSKLSPQQLAEIDRTYTLNPGDPLKQRVETCEQRCNALFPNGPCNTECKTHCPQLVATCNCITVMSLYGPIHICSVEMEEEDD